MRCRKSGWAFAGLTLAVLVVAMGPRTAQALEQIMTSTAVGGNDNWNQTANWNSGLGPVPSGADSAVISAGLAAKADVSPAAYSGGLTLNAGSSLRIFGSDAEPAIGSGPITMADGTLMTLGSNNGSTFTFSQTITLAGDATIKGGISTSGHHCTRNFEGVISGPYQFTLDGVNNNTFNLNTANTFDGLVAMSTQNQGFRVEANVTGSLGVGNVTFDNAATLQVDAADVIADDAGLYLNGGKDSRRDAKLILNADETVNELWIDGTRAFPGTYNSSREWIAGSGILTVLTGATDVAPTISPSDFVDDVFGGPIYEGFPVNYTLTFSDDMDESLITAAVFGNAGDATFDIGTITKTVTPLLPNMPSVFSVEVLPSSAGSLQLQINAEAVLTDVGGLALDTTSAILDDTLITINPGAAPPTTISGAAGGNDSWNDPANWDNGVPFGARDAIVAAGVTAKCWNAATPAYTGTLTLEENATLQLGWTNPQYPADVNALGSAVTMKSGSQLRLRVHYTVNLPEITLEGDGSIHLSPSTSAHHTTRNLDGEITGSGDLTVTGNNNNTLNLNIANPDWSGDFIANADDGWRVQANVTGAFGTGDVYINDRPAHDRGVTLIINAEDVIDDAAILYLNGPKDNRKDSKLILNFDDTVAGFWLDGVEQAPGTYDSSSGLVDILDNPLITGSGILTVMAPITALYWQEGTSGNWADAMWTTTPGTPEDLTPTANNDMTIDQDDTVVTVAADFVSGDTGPATSVAIGETHTAKLLVDSGITLEVTDAVGVGDSGTLQVDGTLQAPTVNASGVVSGSGTITGDLALSAGEVLPGTSVGTLTVDGNVTVGDGSTYVAELQEEGTSDLLEVTGTLDLQGTDDVLALDWLPGSDAGSKFGGEYVVAQAAVNELLGKFDLIVGNVTAAYLDTAMGPDGTGLEYDQGLEGEYPAAVAVFLYDLLDGDGNMDGSANGDDLSLVAGAWLGAGAWGDGDFNFDGTIDGDDLSLLAGEWNTSVGGGGGGMTLPASAVPEPGSLLLLLGAAAAALAFAWRRRG